MLKRNNNKMKKEKKIIIIKIAKIKNTNNTLEKLTMISDVFRLVGSTCNSKLMLITTWTSRYLCILIGRS